MDFRRDIVPNLKMINASNGDIPPGTLCAGVNVNGESLIISFVAEMMCSGCASKHIASMA